jgi:hypothetical protein
MAVIVDVFLDKLVIFAPDTLPVGEGIPVRMAFDTVDEPVQLGRSAHRGAAAHQQHSQEKGQ